MEKVFDEDITLAKLRGIHNDSSHDASAKLQTALNRIVWDIKVGHTQPELWKSQIEILKLSLERGVNPNMPFYKGLSAWGAALWLCNPTDITSAEAWAEIIEVLVQYGADPSVETLDMIKLSGRDTGTQGWHSPLWAIREKFSPSLKSKTEERRIRKVSDRLQARILALGG